MYCQKAGKLQIPKLEKTWGEKPNITEDEKNVKRQLNGEKEDL